MKEALSFSETFVLARATRRNIPEDAIRNLIWTVDSFRGLPLWLHQIELEYDHLLPDSCTLFMIYFDVNVGHVTSFSWRLVGQSQTIAVSQGRVPCCRCLGCSGHFSGLRFHRPP
jgi:hypothetical protein